MSTAEELIAATAAAREVVRELHEATKDARDAKRALDEAKAGIQRDANALINDALVPFQEEIQRWMTAERRNIVAAVVQADENVKAKAAELAGLRSGEEFMQYLVDSLSVVLREATETMATKVEKNARRAQQTRRKR